MSTKTHLIKSTTIISLSTVLSRIFGFIRDMIIAQFLGTTMIADVFFAGFGITNMLKRLLSEGSLSAGIIPVFTTYIKKGNQEETNILMSSVLWLVLIISLFFTLLGILFTPLLVKIIVPGFISSPDKISLTITVTRWLMPYVIFLGISATLMGMLNSYKHFFLPAISPAIFNVGIIIITMIFGFLYNRPLAGIIIGVLFGGLMQVVVQFPMIFHKGFNLKFKLWHPAIKGIQKIIGPAIFALAIAEINIVITRIIASWEFFGGEGAISVLYYANRLIQLPIGIFGVAISTAILPTISNYVLENNIEKVKLVLSHAFRLTLFILIPATVGLIVLRIPIVRLLFERGKFTPESTVLTSQALLFYSLGIVGYVGVKIVIPVFYSFHDTLTPAKIGLFILVLNLFLDFLLGWFMKFSGLALSISCTNFIQLIFLIYFLRKKIGVLGLREIFASLLSITLVSLLMGISCFILVGFLESHLVLNLLTHRLFEVTICVLSGVIIFFVFSYVFKLKEMEIIYEIIRQRGKRA